jgi:hypothetical protein
MRLPGDDIVSNPKAVTNHALTIDAPPGGVWPWLVQMGRGRGGWHTARWVGCRTFASAIASPTAHRTPAAGS